jgi:hypothetical protein
MTHTTLPHSPMLYEVCPQGYVWMCVTVIEKWQRGTGTPLAGMTGLMITLVGWLGWDNFYCPFKSVGILFNTVSVILFILYLIMCLYDWNTPNGCWEEEKEDPCREERIGRMNKEEWRDGREQISRHDWNVREVEAEAWERLNKIRARSKPICSPKSFSMESQYLEGPAHIEWHMVGH